MKLYFSPAACSLAVHIALREAGLPFELAKVDLVTHTLADGSDYRRVSPRGYVPLLEFDDGTRHTEAAALLQYIADREASQALIGAPGTVRRQQVIEWLAFISSELHRGFSPWLWHKETADSTRAAAKAKLALRFEELDRHFETHEHLSEGFSVADAYAFTILDWAGPLGMSLAACPRLRAYLARIAERPQVQAAMRAEGLLK